MENKRIIVFPEINNVFNDNHEGNALCFWPLCSISLSSIDSAKSGYIHFVNIWDPGQYNAKYFDIYRSQYWIRLRLVDDKYEFNGSYNSFPKFKSLSKWRSEALEDFEANKEVYLNQRTVAGQTNDYKMNIEKRRKRGSDYSLYYEMVLSYLITKENFKRTGKLVQSMHFTDGFNYQELMFVNQIGGIPQLPRYEIPVSRTGQSLHYIGSVTGWYYNVHGMDSIHLFYDREKKDAVQIFKFS